MTKLSTEEAITRLQWSIGKLANAVTPTGAMPGEDAAGGKVGSLTEATMGITGGLMRIAEAIEELAAAVREIPPVRGDD